MIDRNVRVLCIALLIAVCSVGRVSAQSDPLSDPPKSEKRVLGVIPNYRTVDASLPFEKLSPRRKLSIAAHDSFDWPTFVVAGFLTLITSDDEFGTGIQGYASHYAHSSADQI